MQLPVQLPQQPMIRAGVPPQLASLLPTDLSISGVPQRIDKLISENQAIVESDWPKRFSRQNSKDGVPPKEEQQAAVGIPAVIADTRKRRGSGAAQFSLSKVPAVTTAVLTTAAPPNNPPVHQLMQVKPIESLREPVSAAAELLPLNLTAATAAYQRRTSESSNSSHHTPIQANSIKELWLNSCKQSPAVTLAARSTTPSKIPSVVSSSIVGGGGPPPVKPVQLEDLDNNTAAFHPQNPEGSMIKELLLKHRMQERAAAAAAVASLNSKSTVVSAVTTASEAAYQNSLVGVPKAKLMVPTVVTAKPNEVGWTNHLDKSKKSQLSLFSLTLQVPSLKRPMEALPGCSSSIVEPKRMRDSGPGLPNGLLQITRPLMPEQAKAQEQHAFGPPPSMRVLGAAIHKLPTMLHPPSVDSVPGIPGPSSYASASSRY